MPYFIEKDNKACKSGWAVTGGEGKVHGCHTTKASAIKQAVAISLSTDEPFKGERAAVGELSIGDYVTWDEITNSLGEVEVIAGPLAGIRIYEEEDGYFKPTDNLVIVNVLKLKKIPRPEMVAEKMPEVQDQSVSPDQTYDPSHDTMRNADGPQIIISDIDDTLLRSGTQLIQKTYDYIQSLDGALFLVTGRPESTRDRTVAALKNAGVSYSRLIMNTGATSESATFKKETAKNLLETYDVVKAIENDSTTLRYYRELGIDAIDPADIQPSENRAVSLTPPAFMRAAARRGLALYEQGKGGDGLVEATIREARAMAAGNVTADKWVRIAAWIARHMPDLDAPKNSDPSDPDYPGPGLVAHLLWGSGPSKRRAERAMAYAQRIVDRLKAEGERGKDMTKEQRTNNANFEIRESGNGMTYSGYAAVWDSPSEPLPFIERIQRGAFKKTLQSRNEIKLLWNHDPGQVLGSLRAGTLRLYEDNYGLKVEADLPDTQLGRDTATLLKRGDVSAMSFGFTVPKGGDAWNQDGTERTLKSVRLFEVSIVAWPAYSATAGTASVRSFDKLALRSNVDEDTLSDVMLKLEDGSDLTAEEAAIITEAVNALTQKPEAPAEPETLETLEEVEANLLELKRKQLELIKKKVL